MYLLSIISIVWIPISFIIIYFTTREEYGPREFKKVEYSSDSEEENLIIKSQ